MVKNRKKDGSHYWVQTVINPIIDIEGNIVEFIGIRTDITEMQEIKEKLKEELNISEEHFEDVYRMAQLYEKAIDESNILSRTKADGTILYINSRFSEITGYTEDEIKKAVTTERYAYAISQDIQTANQIGVKGVPFFIFNDKYAASGAQPVAFFEEILQKSWEEYSAGDQGLNIISESDSCDINGENC